MTWVLFAVAMAFAAIGGIGGLVIGACAVFAPDKGPLADILNDLTGIETRELPGDARRFDPVAALPEVQAYAGENARLISLEWNLVRADGTLDLEAPYTPKPSATYEFAREVPRPENAPPPGAGGANTGPWYRNVSIRAYDPGQRRTIIRNGRRSTYANQGLERGEYDATTARRRFVDPPTCPIRDLFAVAIARGAPPDAVARVVYDADGYSFTISGVGISLEFDAACQPKER